MSNFQKNHTNLEQKLTSLTKIGNITISRNRKGPKKSTIQSEFKQKLTSLVQAGNLTISRSTLKKKFSQNTTKKEIEYEKKSIPRTEYLKPPIKTVHESQNDVVFDSPSTQKRNLNIIQPQNHQKNHQYFYEYICKFCRKSYAKTLALKRHIQKVHQGKIEYYPCPTGSSY